MAYQNQAAPFWDFMRSFDNINNATHREGAGVDHPDPATSVPEEHPAGPLPPYADTPFAGYGRGIPGLGGLERQLADMFGPGFGAHHGHPHHGPGHSHSHGGRGGRGRRHRHGEPDENEEECAPEEGHPAHGPHGPHGRHGHGPRGHCGGFGGRGGWARTSGRGFSFGGPGAHTTGEPFDLSALFAQVASHPLAQAFQTYAQQNGMAGERGEASRGQDFGTTTKEDENTFIPPIDIFSTPSSYVLHVALPGAKKEDVGVNWDAEKSELNVAGVVYRQGDEQFLKSLSQSERKVGVFERSVKLPLGDEKEEVDADGISAKLEDGVLVITVLKVEKEWTEIRKVDIE